MRVSAFAGLLACVIIFAASNNTASAQALDLSQTKTTTGSDQLLDWLKTAPKLEEPAPAEPPAPEPKVHTVAPEETLSSIAVTHQTTWRRLFDKNPNLANPDVIQAGTQLTIPTAEEQLTERPLPQPVIEQQDAAQTAAVAARAVATAPRTVTSTRGSSSGNTYSYGYCTWYVKNMRPDLPNNLGDASQWVRNAQAQGMATGSTPQVGAVGQRNNHVVYVESVNGDNTVTISEMNHTGWNQVSRRTVPASYFFYIY